MLSVLPQDSCEFPDPEYALDEPNGLLAIGGDLEPDRILAAYRQGIFPWYETGQPILWWSPDPRMVLFPFELHISRSLRKAVKKTTLRITADHDFQAVIAACAERRPYASGTWITPEMEKAYIRLHEMGIAHSVEAWQDERLVGGLYGLSQGAVFYGESMFNRQDNASKIAFACLVKQLEKQDYDLIDCQVASSYLASFGAREIPRGQFRRLLDTAWRPEGNALFWNERWPPPAELLLP